MRYLFLDLQWGEQEKISISKREILEIAGVCYDECGQSEVKMSKLVKPEQIETIEEQVLQFLKLSRSKLEGAQPLKEILDKFFSLFREFDVLVVWNRNTYEILSNSMKRYGKTMPEHRMVILQELLCALDETCQTEEESFETIMRRYCVSCQSEMLHSSKYIAECLKNLYYAVRNQYQHQCDKESHQEYVVMSTSGKMHSERCSYIARSCSEQMKRTTEIGMFYGYQMCKCCMREKRFMKLPKNLNFDQYNEDEFSEQNIRQMCRRFHMDYNIADGLIFIRTRFASWRIYHDNQKIEGIYHENYQNRSGKYEKRRKKINEGFHKQQVICNTLYDALNYIYNHDKYFLHEKKDRQNKIDQLFALIEQKKVLKSATE